MKKILLTQGLFALVDDADYDELSQYKWCAVKLRDLFYAVRNSPMKDGKSYLILMSRQILGLKYKDKRQADHQNHNTLDNSRYNLRICTSQQNQMNKKSYRNKTSQFKGVYWDRSRKKWLAQIQIKGRTKYLGLFPIEKVATTAYDLAAKKIFGEFAHLNFNYGGF